MPSLSTHVLDAARGGPKSAVTVEVTDEEGLVVATGQTDAAGRIADLAPELAIGRYQIRWQAAADADAVLVAVAVTITLGEERHYHVPLLSSPASAVVYLGV